MKKSILLVVLFAGLTASVAAQSLRQTEKIDDNQVPVEIQKAFEKDFGKIPDDGYWTASFIVEREGARSAAKPLSYTYHKKNKTEKIEVRYTVDGKLDFAKGLEMAKDPSS